MLDLVDEGRDRVGCLHLIDAIPGEHVLSAEALEEVALAEAHVDPIGIAVLPAVELFGVVALDRPGILFAHDTAPVCVAPAAHLLCDLRLVRRDAGEPSVRPAVSRPLRLRGSSRLSMKKGSTRSSASSTTSLARRTEPAR